MDKKNKSRIDENAHQTVPALGQRLRNALIAVVMGIVLVQVIRFNSVVVLMDNIYFIGYLILCAIFGWWKGEKFIGRINREIGYWKFW